MQKYQDSTLAPEERARDLLAQMDLEEKFGQIQCYNVIDSFMGKGVDTEFPHGVGQVSALAATMMDSADSIAAIITKLQKQIMETGKHHIPAIFHIEALTGVMVTPATSFPCGLGQASTWDTAQQQQMAACIGRQGRALGLSHALAPVFDICRDSRFGRMGETYGEDPTLAAAMGTAYVKGLQSGHRMSACSKHFLGFMAGQGGIHTARAVVSPRELREVYAKPFQAAITEGELDSVMNSYAALDGQAPAGSKAILRDLLRGEMGFTGVTVSDYSAVEQLASIYHLAQDAADAGRMALEAGMDQELPTKAAYNDTLKESIRSGKVREDLLDEAVLRILTMKFKLGLFENPFPAAQPQAAVTEADTALSRKMAQDSMVLLKNDGVLPLGKNVKKIAIIGWHADSTRALFGGYSAMAMKENTLGVTMSMAGIQADPNSPVATAPKQNTYPGSPVLVENPGAEPLVRRCYPGIHSMLDALRIACPNTEFVFETGYPYAGNDESGHAAALQAAQGADLVICTLGGHYGWNASCTTGEGIDSMHIGLPVCQERFLEKLADLHKPVIGVHFDGRPISSDAADRVCNAILEAWAPGAQGGDAIADLLTGQTNPCGKLPCTVPLHEGQIPVYYNHPAGSCYSMHDGIPKNAYIDGPHTPRYCFGHGLSYTNFAYGAMTLSDDTVPADGTLTAELSVSNTGRVPGTEVVQFYIHDLSASIVRPVKELVGFAKVHLQPGETKTVRLTLPMSQLAFLDADMRWKVEHGTVCLMAGASSEDIRQSSDFEIAGDAYPDGKTRSFAADTEVL
ncbi:glycoside hydrolase family 3 N-terminal domain-containing protein [Gemmiger sp.]